MTNLKVGELYFMMWYPDDARKYLVPDSIVFLGMNLEINQGLEDAWYFQDADSFCVSGPALGANELVVKNSQHEARIYRLLQADLTQIVDSRGLAEELTRCSERRQASSP